VQIRARTKEVTGRSHEEGTSNMVANWCGIDACSVLGVSSGKEEKQLEHRWRQGLCVRWVGHNLIKGGE